MLRRTSSQCPRPGSDQAPTRVVLATNPNRSGVALCCPHQRSDVATGHRVSPRPTAALPPAPSHAPCRPTAAHCSSPPAHNTGPVPPATAAVAGHCRTPYPQLPRQRAHQPPPRGRSSPGPVVLWCGRPHPGAHRLPAAAPRPPPIPGAGRAPDPGRPRRDDCHRPGTPRSDRSPPSPPCRCTAASPPPTSCPASGTPSHPLPAPLRDHPDAPPRTLAEPAPVKTGVVTHPVRIPVVHRQQPLHPIGRGVPSILGQLPPVLALHRPQQSLQSLPL